MNVSEDPRMERKIRVGLLLDSTDVPYWQYLLVKRLTESEYASVVLMIQKQSQAQKRSLWRKILENRKNLFYILYITLEQRLIRPTPNAFEVCSLSTLLKEVPLMKVETIQSKFSDRFKPEDIDSIVRSDLDVLIRFGFGILRGGILNAAKYGIWSYHHGDNVVNRGGPAGTWEVLEQWPVTGSILQILTDELDAGKVLYRSYSQTDQRSITRNRNKLYWKTLSFLPRKLEELHRNGESSFFKAVEKQNQAPAFYDNRLFRKQQLSNWQMTKFAAGMATRYLRDKVVNLFYFDQWILLFRFGDGLSTSFWRFKKIIPPEDRFYADPFIVVREGKHYVFIEEFVYKNRRGHIAVMEIARDGTYSDPVPILNMPYHLSYPFVFEYSGDYYLVPESRVNGSIDLFKCTDFPHEWEFHMRLFESVDGVDATLHFYENRWWMFVNMVDNPGGSSFDELFLFFTDDLFSGSWTPHPQNPIVSDVCSARPAGKIFDHHGKLYRPSQNSAKRYGYGMKINEITKLTTQEYEEIEVASIEPNWERTLLATHTLNSDGGLTIIDAVLLRSKYS